MPVIITDASPSRFRKAKERQFNLHVRALVFQLFSQL